MNSRASYGSNSSIIDQALLQNDELRSLLGVAPEKKADLPGPHICSICCTIFSVMGAAFLVRARTSPRNCRTSVCLALQFLIHNLLSNDYEYIEIEGSKPDAAPAALTAGFLYLGTGIISIGFWIRGCYARRAAERSASASEHSSSASDPFLDISHGSSSGRNSAQNALLSSDGL